jgi:hypothetical protein
MRANNRFREYSRCEDFRGPIETAKTDPAVALRPLNPNFSNDYLEHLGEYEAICETALAHESGP